MTNRPSSRPTRHNPPALAPTTQRPPVPPRPPMPTRPISGPTTLLHSAPSRTLPTRLIQSAHFSADRSRLHIPSLIRLISPRPHARQGIPMTIDIERDIAQELRDIINKQVEAAGPVWTASEVASRVVIQLRVHSPELLAKWLDAQATRIVREAVSSVARSIKATAKQTAQEQSASVFQDAIRRYEAGDQKALSPWLDSYYVINGEYQRKQLRDMEKEDLLYAAGGYTKLAEQSGMQAAFLRALAQRVGAGTVGDTLTAEDVARLWRSLST